MMYGRFYVAKGKPRKKYKPLAKRSIYYLGLNSIINHKLIGCGINTIGDLMATTSRRLEQKYYVGKKTTVSVREALLKRAGLHWH